jgi:GT2 family glycosyltransferase
MISGNMSSQIDLSIIIVHATGVEILRQTLRSIRRSAPKLDFEIIIVDNNVKLGLEAILIEEFPEVKYTPMLRNVGFAAGMNVGIKQAVGKYVLIFNPDMIVQPNSLEILFDFMEKNEGVGIVGPRLLNTYGTLQYSCFRLPTAFLPLIRRTALQKTEFGKEKIAEYMMVDVDHDQIMDVDSLLGGAMFTRKSMLEQVGLFDERYFLYYEDNDLCREFWKKGFRVVYNPRSEMVHYHRRATADGGFFKQITSWITWVQIISFFKYMLKFAGEENPRLKYGELQSSTKNIERTEKKD